MSKRQDTFPPLIIYIIITAFVPFVVLAFYNRPSADDLFLYYEVHKKGVLGTYHYMYTQLSGRYTSLLVLLSLSYFRCIFEHYAVVPLVMLGLTYCGILFCIRQINRFIINNYFSNNNVRVIAAILLLLYIVVMPEPSTGFYWLSGCITHQLPVILLLFATGFYLQMVFCKEKRWLNLLFSSVFLFAAIGCNEMLAMYLAALLFAVVIYSFSYKSGFFKYILLLFTVAVLGNIFLFLGSGQQNRAGGFLFQSSFTYAFGASLLKYTLLQAHLFAGPFFWFCIVGIIVFFKNVPVEVNFNFKVKWWFVYFIALAFIFYFLVYLVNPSGVPERSNNPLSFVLMVSFILMACHLSLYVRGKLSFPLHYSQRVILTGIFIFTLFFSRNFLVAVEGLFSGPVYSSIYDNRIQKINEAKYAGRNSVEFSSYDKAWEKYIYTNLPAMFHKPMMKLVNPYPQTIFFSDDIQDTIWITSYAEYYNIDTIKLDGVPHLRFELDEKARKDNNGFK
ncbi:MAG: hypothetical protein QM763_00560 [Agriterribacter sp.]